VSLGDLKKEATQRCRQKLVDLGYQSKRKGVLRKELAPRVYGMALTRTVVYRAESLVALDPMVGVFHPAIEEVVKGWWPVARVDNPRKTTTSIQLGYLMPEDQYIRWYITCHDDLVSAVPEVVENILKYGEPWMKQLCDYRLLLALLHKEARGSEYLKYVIPAIYILQGEKEKAREYVRMVIEDIDDKGPDYFWSGFTPHWSENYKDVMLKI
jgi:hypothetical protein